MGQAAAVMPASLDTVWKTIRLGSVASVPKLEKTLLSARCCVSDDARAAMHDRRFELEHTPKDISLCVLSAQDLGFDGESTNERIFARARAYRDLLLCPPETGPQLRLQYLDQPDGECLVVAMYPLRPEGSDQLFRVGRSRGKLFLDTARGSGSWAWPADTKFVFVLPS